MKPGKNFQEIAKGKTISTAFYFNRTRLKSTVRLKLAASTALQPHFNRKILERSLQELNTM